MHSMRILILLMILSLACGGAIAACPDDHAGHADCGCPGVCCQPAFTPGPSETIAVHLAICHGLPCRTDGPNDDPLVRVLFRPPEVA